MAMELSLHSGGINANFGAHYGADRFSRARFSRGRKSHARFSRGLKNLAVKNLAVGNLVLENLASMIFSRFFKKISCILWSNIVEFSDNQ